MLNHCFYLYVFLIAAGISFVLTPLVKKIAAVKGIYDRPGHRKVHATKMPTMGGVAMYLAFMSAMFASFFFAPDEMRDFSVKYIGLYLGAMIIVGLGVYDDVKGMNAKFKLVVQILVAAILIVCGYGIEEITNPVGGTLHVGFFGLLFTVIWIVGLINAINFLDGLDGLASGITAIIAFFLFLAALKQDNVVTAFLAAALVGSCIGFLPFNFSPAKIFMGNAGSMFLGLVLATIALEGFNKSRTIIALIVPIIALGIPIIDVTLAVLRRLMRGLHIFHADKEHIHHQLLIDRKSHSKVVLSMYFLCCCFGLIALSFTGIRGIFAIAALGLVIVVTFDWIRKSGFLDFK
ncbi:MAG: undecaprenyl/decaprenyl-phosphate alpha-N-acetylglucosaminyl 1-phosphate transferase [Candidatus Aureabacteria bacterium]|nr:undecaprenyl/decaprenyl-phosphate alpha-N-acetylglucosaminyl 1-phosphate transferase [Candidatus Auribacterota bacterium]